MSTPPPPARWLRAGVLAGASVGLSAAGHLLGGGHADPLFVALLTGAVLLGGHAWLTRERGLVAIVAAVTGVQVGTHLLLSVGHSHSPSGAMLLTHAGAALALAVFLRLGEARLYVAARRRLTWLLVAVRIAAAGLPGPLPRTPVPAYKPAPLTTLWTVHAVSRRGPPVAL